MFLLEIQISKWCESELAVWYCDLSESAVEDYRKKYAYMPEGQLRDFMRETYSVNFFRKPNTDNRDMFAFMSEKLDIAITRCLYVI